MPIVQRRGAPSRFLVFVTLVLAHAARLRAATYYVRASGNDSNDGLSPETAFASVRTAARLLRQPGDRLIVGPGTYHEGNVEPRASGAPDAPIMLVGDASGTLTRDAAGAVTIVPPNSPDATTGIIVYGRHDIRIEGFTIESAVDAGIQVRRGSATKAPSERVTISGNTVLDSRKGIHAIDSDSILAVGNTITNVETGIGVFGGNSAVVSGNTVTGSQTGVFVSTVRAAVISGNDLRGNGRGVRGALGQDLTITDNAIGRGARTEAVTNMDIERNTFESGGSLSGGGHITIAHNQFLNRGLIASTDGRGTLRLTENLFQALYASGGAVELENNDLSLLEAVGGTITVVNNRIAGEMRVEAGGGLELRDNQADNLEAIGSRVIVQGNDYAGPARITADGGTVADNTADAWKIRLARYHNGPDELTGPFRVEHNRSRGGVTVGESFAPYASAEVNDNIVGGMLSAHVRDELIMSRNETAGLTAVLTAPESQLLIAENLSHYSKYAGLLVIGAGSAVVKNNSAVDNRDSGLAVRRSRNVTVSDNELSGNLAGGLSLLMPLSGDCNHDQRVSVEELVAVVEIVLGKRGLLTCKAADADDSGNVTVDELELAVAAALDRPDLRASDVVVRGNRVDDNGGFGISLHVLGSVMVSDNRVLYDGGVPIAVYGGDPLDTAEITGNVIGFGQDYGLALEGVPDGQVRNNVIFSNDGGGVILNDTPGASVVNNLIYANRQSGVTVAPATMLPPGGITLMNNTIFGNGDWGIRLRSGGGPPMGTVIVNNILQHNLPGGVEALSIVLPGLMMDFNLNPDGYSADVLASPTDFTGDPGFVAPAGRDGVLGGRGFEDDDFHLRPGSIAVDAGSGLSADLGISGSALAGADADVGIVDVGYHYDASAP